PPDHPTTQPPNHGVEWSVMAEESSSPQRRRFGLRDLSGTTVALTSLAVLGAAAVVTAPLVFWYRRKRKRVDALVREGSRVPAPSDEAASSPASSQPSDETPRE
ncbi:MAG: hypothetical protein ACM3NQ_05825, partial [Bacteroidales bacterium]